MKTDGSLAINDRDKCNVFNDSFASVFTIDNGVLPVFHPNVSCVQAYQQVEITHSKVLCALKRLPSKYSRTPDGFPAGFFKISCFCHCLSIVQAYYNVYGLRMYTSGLETGNCLSHFQRRFPKIT